MLKSINFDQINTRFNIHYLKISFEANGFSIIFSKADLIINLIEAAWIKPKNIQENLICDIKIKTNSRGRIVDISLINSSGNIRFDNSALQAVRRVETFAFFNEITKKTYEDVFKNIVISFNPS